MRLLYFFLALFLTSQMNSQELIQNKKDEFTGNLIKRTSWEMFTSASARSQLRVSIVNVDSLGTALNIKFMAANTMPTVIKGGELMLKLDNDEIVTLKADSSQSPCLGCGATGLIGSEAYGVAAYYRVSDEQLEKLITHSVKKARIYLSSGFADCEISEKGAKKFINALKLVSK